MKLFHRQFGNGSDLIILHGLLGVSDNWIRIGKKLSENFNVLIPDLRNHGRSEHNDSFDYDCMSDDIIELVHTNKLINPILIGHSMGGKLAMNLAVNHSELFPKIVVVDISPKEYEVGQIHESVLEFMQSIDFETIKSRKEIEKLVIKKFKDRNICFWILKNLYKKSKTEFRWRANIDIIYKNILEIKKALAPNHISKIPALFIKGEKSDYIKAKDHSLIQNHFPNSEIKSIKNASHWVHADAEDELFEMVLSFLNGH